MEEKRIERAPDQYYDIGYLAQAVFELQHEVVKLEQRIKNLNRATYLNTPMDY